MSTASNHFLPIQVVGLALFDPDKKRYLIVRRSPDQSGAGHWEFPGGKVEPFESKTEALVREIKEELALDLDPKKLCFIASNTHAYPLKTIELHLYKYTTSSEQITEQIILIDHDAKAWVNQSEIGQFQISAADIAFIKYLF